MSSATPRSCRALRAGTWIRGQQQRLRQLAPGTWPQHLAAVLAACPGRPDNDHGDSAVEIAIYPDVIWLARILRAHRQPTAP